ncbi:MAG: DNA polymerase Y family protein [Gammaproteobacteria bacterium]
MRYKSAQAAPGSKPAKRLRPRPYLLHPADPATERSPQSWLCLLTDAPECAAPLALSWTSRVSIEPPDALLLEVGGSRRLFGDLAALRNGVEQAFATRGWTLRHALAPTPRAALWLARDAPGTWVESASSLPGMLGKVPLTALGLPPKVLERLHGFGLRRLQDVSRLPRGPLARRVGPELGNLLAQALGSQPDPREDWQAPPRFSARCDFEFEVASAELLRRALTPLFAELVMLLRATNRGVRRCTVVFHHRAAPPTRMRLGVLDPVQDAARLEQQLALHLEKAPLPAPALGVALHAARLERVAAITCDLFAPRHGGDSWHALIERLRTRLGDDYLFGVETRDDHRPERAAGRCVDMVLRRRGVAAPVARRPLWLLPEPRRVKPSRFRFESGPERIESGWWDGDDVRRDYFVARDAGGACSWVFRERTAPYRWFLHGLFG